MYKVAYVFAFGYRLADESGADFYQRCVGYRNMCRNVVKVDIVSSPWVYHHVMVLQNFFRRFPFRERIPVVGSYYERKAVLGIGLRQFA